MIMKANEETKTIQHSYRCNQRVSDEFAILPIHLSSIYFHNLCQIFCLKLKQTSCTPNVTEKRHTHCTHYESCHERTKGSKLFKKVTLIIMEPGNTEILKFIPLIGHHYLKSNGIILKEYVEIVIDNSLIANIFNVYFLNISNHRGSKWRSVRSNFTGHPIGTWISGSVSSCFFHFYIRALPALSNYYFAFINRARGLYGKILTEVVSPGSWVQTHAFCLDLKDAIFVIGALNLKAAGRLPNFSANWTASIINGNEYCLLSFSLPCERWLTSLDPLWSSQHVSFRSGHVNTVFVCVVKWNKRARIPELSYLNARTIARELSSKLCCFNLAKRIHRWIFNRCQVTV